jgi:hypothetical protein
VVFIGPAQDLFLRKWREVLDIACATLFREKLGQRTAAGQETQSEPERLVDSLPCFKSRSENGAR